MDPSGNGYNTNWKLIDLCKKCYNIESKKYGDAISKALTPTGDSILDHLSHVKLNN